MRGVFGGVVTGGVLSAIGLGVASLMSEQPAGITPPEAPLVQAPVVEPVVEPGAEPVDGENNEAGSGPSTPVGSVSIQEPQAPALPEGEAALQEPDAPSEVEADAQAPRADTDPLDEPEVSAIEGALEAPDASDGANISAEPVDPVLPNPQSLAPQTPDNEADLTVSTAPAQPIVVIEPEEDAMADDAMVEGEGAEDTSENPAAESDDFFVVDLGADATPSDEPSPDTDADMAQDTAEEMADPEDTPEPDTQMAQIDTDTDADTEMADAEPVADAAPAAQGEDIALNAPQDDPAEPRVQLGGANTLLSDRDTGVTIRRPSGGDDAEDTNDTATADATGTTNNALTAYAADVGDTGAKPLMSIVLIDDGSMSAASAALAGLPFAVTIALDPALPDAAELMETYRADGFEVAVLAKLPEGALPTDVEVTFESVFSSLPETIAVLDVGEGGLQSDRAVTEQAMDILATQGRGFITVSQGLNMAGRAADAAGVSSAVVSRILDNDDQDARVVRRFVDQAAFRARQESGVVLVGRVRPDTISALILWGTANQDDQVAVVPVSAILSAQ